MAKADVSAWTVFQGAMASLALTFVDRPVHSSLPKFAKIVEDNQKLLLNRFEELHEKTVTDACVMAASAFEAEVSAQLEEAVTALRIWNEKMPSSKQSGFALLHTNWFGEKKANEGQDPFDSLAASRAQEVSIIIHILSVCSKKEPLKLDCTVIQAWSRFDQNPPDWCALSEKMIAFRVAARRILLGMGIAHFRNVVPPPVDAFAVQWQTKRTPSIGDTPEEINRLRKVDLTKLQGISTSFRQTFLPFTDDPKQLRTSNNSCCLLLSYASAVIDVMVDFEDARKEAVDQVNVASAEKLKGVSEKVRRLRQDVVHTQVPEILGESLSSVELVVSDLEDNICGASVTLVWSSFHQAEVGLDTAEEALNDGPVPTFMGDVKHDDDLGRWILPHGCMKPLYDWLLQPKGRKFTAGYQVAVTAYEDCKNIFKTLALPSNMSPLPDLNVITARRLKFDSAFAYCTVSQLLYRDLRDGESRQSLLAEGRLLLAEEGLPPQVLAMLSAA